MKVEEKLKEDIRYWEEQEREASEVLRYASAVLPRLRESLREIEGNGHSGGATERMPVAPSEGFSRFGRSLTEELARQLERGNSAPAAQAASAPARLTGDCGAQIMQALAAVDRELVANELMDYLRDHGTAFSRGAIDYQLRALWAAKKIGRKKPESPGLKAVWAYYLPTGELPPPPGANGGALIG